MQRPTRRRALRDALLLVGGALGAGALSERITRRDATAAGAQAQEQFTLFGQGWTRFASDRLPGQVAQRGDRLTTEAQLFDRLDGHAVGVFYAAGFTVRHPATTGGGSALELHTFELADGSIIGSGAAGSSGRTGVFAILGGTGRYHGATGSYVAEQGPFDGNGNGTARFSFTLLR